MSGQGRHGGRRWCRLHSQEEERDGCLCSVHSVLVILSRSPAHGIIPTTFGASIFTDRRWGQGSMVILNTIRLPGENNHHKRPKCMFQNHSHQIEEAKVAVLTVLHRKAEVQGNGGRAAVFGVV